MYFFKIINHDVLLQLFSLELTVGFVKTVYSVSEGDGTVTVTVGILDGTVGAGETVILQFSTRNDLAVGMYLF